MTVNQTYPVPVSASVLRGKARMRLCDDGVRVTLIFALLITVFAGILGLLVGELLVNLCFPFLIDGGRYTNYFLADLICYFPAIVFALPLCGGTVRLTGRIAKGEAPDLRELFWAFSSPAKLLRVTFAVAFPLIKAVTVLALVFVRDFLPREVDASIPSPFGSLLTIAGVLLSLLFLRVTRVNGMLCWFAAVEDQPLARAFRSAGAAVSERWTALKLLFSMTGWFLLAFATVLVSGFADTFPQYILSRAVRAEEYVRNSQSETTT